MSEREREQAAAVAARDQAEADLAAQRERAERAIALNRVGLVWCLAGLVPIGVGLVIGLFSGPATVGALCTLVGVVCAAVGLVFSLASGRPDRRGRRDR